MARQKLAVVTRRFWPFCGPSEISAGEIACAIHDAGHAVEVLTIRWEKNWPRDFLFREIEVKRLGRPATGPWGTFRFLRSFSRHLREAKLDGVVVIGLGDESWAAIRSALKHCAVVVRITADDMNLQNRDQFSNRQVGALNAVRQIIVDSKQTADRILKANPVDPKLIVVSNGIERGSLQKPSLEKKNQARTALTDAHPVLMIEESQPLVVCGVPLVGDLGVIDLVNAWTRVLDQFPSARLWILGDGIRGRQVWERICELNLAHTIIMPGYFDELTDVMNAADVYVHPLRTEAGCDCLVRALAAGTCSIATKLPTHLNHIEKNVNGLLAPVQNPMALAEAINLALSKPDLRKRLGETARVQTKAYDLSQTISTFINPLLDPVEREIQTAEQ